MYYRRLEFQVGISNSETLSDPLQKTEKDSLQGRLFSEFPSPLSASSSPNILHSKSLFLVVLLDKV